jgi:hypothetical protein
VAELIKFMTYKKTEEKGWKYMGVRGFGEEGSREG